MQYKLTIFSWFLIVDRRPEKSFWSVLAAAAAKISIKTALEAWEVFSRLRGQAHPAARQEEVEQFRSLWLEERGRVRTSQEVIRVLLDHLQEAERQPKRRAEEDEEEDGSGPGPSGGRTHKRPRRADQDDDNGGPTAGPSGTSPA